MFASARLIDRTSGRPQPGIPAVPRLRHSTRQLAACTDGIPCAPCLLDERKPWAATGVARMAVEEASRSSGRPLGTAERRFFEPRFGHSFADVRIHTGSGPAVPEEPRSGSGVDLPKDYTGCSIIWKKGKVYWQCQGAGLPKTPEMPLDPRCAFRPIVISQIGAS